MTTTLNSTTLLSSTTPLNYASGAAPSLNTATINYFSGRSDNFAVGNSLNPNNGRLDPEGIRVSNDGKSIFVSDEYGPCIHEFDPRGRRLRSLNLPGELLLANPGEMSPSEKQDRPARGCRPNAGLDGLAISPDGRLLYGLMQGPLIQDGGREGIQVRIVELNAD